MSHHRKTVALIGTAAEILASHHPMTVRQVFYRLVSRQVIENSRGTYQAVSKALVAARCEGLIPWEWIEDRLRRPRHVSMWQGLADFADTAAAVYRRDIWAEQPRRVECWLEKDALSGIFEDALEAYGVTLNVGRGYDGWASIRNAALRLGAGDTVLYFGDFDPSGEDMVRSLGERLAALGSRPAIVKCALTFDDVRRYELPPDFTKTTDTRRAAFVARWGDIAVELDALPLDALQERIVAEVENRMDLAALGRVRMRETAERRALAAALGRLA
ncbi:MAG TPA: hypothetical protein VJ770_21730 [Stellaceae bacterium]|nr:hypothetical protein [Stellaceae bacterium]